MVVVEKEECLCLFVHNVHFRQTPLMRLSKRENNRLVIILSNLTKHVNLLFIYQTSFRPVPMARHSLTLGRSFSTGHSLPGGKPPGPPVHMFNHSSCTHVYPNHQSYIYEYFYYLHLHQSNNTSG